METGSAVWTHCQGNVDSMVAGGGVQRSVRNKKNFLLILGSQGYSTQKIYDSPFSFCWLSGLMPDRVLVCESLSLGVAVACERDLESSSPGTGPSEIRIHFDIPRLAINTTYLGHLSI